MLIFVEGIDKAGKSTFIENLSTILGVRSYRKYHPILLQDDEFHGYFKGVGFATAELHSLVGFDLIIDRSFISDWVYTNRDSKQKDIEVWQEWERVVKKQNVLLIYLFISKDIFTTRIRRSPDTYMREDEFEKYVGLYDEYLKITTLPLIKIDGSSTFDEQLVALRDGLSASPDRITNADVLRPLRY